jgi:hypothetical protein
MRKWEIRGLGLDQGIFVGAGVDVQWKWPGARDDRKIIVKMETCGV